MLVNFALESIINFTLASNWIISLIFLGYYFNNFAKMEDWICENLSQILDFPVTNEIVQ